MKAHEMEIAKQEIDEFFGNEEFVFANPQTSNFEANFWGEMGTPFNRREILAQIDCALDWSTETDIYSAINAILEDLQFKNPCD